MTIIGEKGIVYGVTGPSRLVAMCGYQIPTNWNNLVRSNRYTRFVSTLVLHLVVENDYNSASKTFFSKLPYRLNNLKEVWRKCCHFY
ncbi:hypothetical protein BK708_11665 [Bacillus thuringiensis serovar yunnanensis]|nr:hypothetical protein BK708_11665 [Bacillus thuringiensis serovar yunnanensis]